MKQAITVQDRTIEITYRKHARAKRISMRIDRHNQVTVTLPKLVPYLFAKQFINQNKAWIINHLNPEKPTKPTHSGAQKPLLKQKARELIRSRLDHYNQHYNFKFLRISIRDQKTRWGSCSSNKTLSFNYKLALLPLELVDYVVVHELCHLKEMNHSNKFWDLVKETLPHYPLLIRKLRVYEKDLY